MLFYCQRSNKPATTLQFHRILGVDSNVVTTKNQKPKPKKNPTSPRPTLPQLSTTALEQNGPERGSKPSTAAADS